MTNSYSDISFTTIAAQYNQINALPEEAAVEIGANLANLIAGSGRALDMGCGAGRIAVPLAGAGVPVIGLDMDPGMLGETVRIAREQYLDLRVIRGDITRMPLASNSFAAVLSINVLHLVPDWSLALSEAIRVMQPGGLLIQGRDWLDPESCAGRLRTRLREVVIVLEPGLQPTAAASPAVVAEALAQAGGKHDREQIAASWQMRQSPNELLAQMAARGHNETWMLSDELLKTVIEQLQAWVNETWADPEASELIERRFMLTVTRGLK